MSKKLVFICVYSWLTLGKTSSYPCYPGNPWSDSVRCQRGDDLFEARVAAQRIPQRMET